MITHPEKVLFPADGITKGELCAYYEAVAPLMLPHVQGRPVTMERYPRGIGERGFIKADRGGRIFVDTGRTGYSATLAAAYAVRARAGAPVSAPCTWLEVESGQVGPRTFTLRTMAERTAEVGDVWAGMLAVGQSLRPAWERLHAVRGSA